MGLYAATAKLKTSKRRGGESFLLVAWASSQSFELIDVSILVSDAPAHID